MKHSIAFVAALGVLGFACGSDNLRGDGDELGGQVRRSLYSNCKRANSCPTGCNGGICYTCDQGTCTCGATSSKCGLCGDDICWCVHIGGC